MKIRIGSRDSALAVRQTEIVINAMKKVLPEAEIERISMKTTGDRLLDRPLTEFGGKGLFVKELDIALMEGKIDLAVHSLKDLPMELPEKLPVLGYLTREDPRDCLILKDGLREKAEVCRAEEFLVNEPVGKLCIGTSSSRRVAQWKSLHPETEIKSIRGNLSTRFRKLEEQDYDGIILAYAGLKRLGWEKKAACIFEPEVMVPAAGQGILAVQARRGYDFSGFSRIFDKDAAAAAEAERSFVRAMGGGCTEPMGALSLIHI